MFSLDNIWITTDTHFRHERIKTLSHRPENFEDLIIADWKNKVKPDDVVIHLGDVAWPNGWTENIIEGLPGKKILVRGNHDTKALTNYMAKGFDFALDTMVMRIEGLTIGFSHAPIPDHPWDINVHGHLHQNCINEDLYPCWCLSLEKHGYGVHNVKELFPLWRAKANLCKREAAKCEK